MHPEQMQVPATHEAAAPQPLPLTGCAPQPLAAYLKALGILRLVAEQADPEARGYWEHDQFILVSRLDAGGLEEFFLEMYRPTALVAPWGGRSGFYAGSSEAAARAALECIATSELERLAPFREAIEAVHSLLQRLGMAGKASDDAKLELLRACRAELPDHVLPWLDACYVLTSEDRAFPPLLGTGGNEGSGSYVSGFAQQVVACVIDRAHDDALPAALFGVARPGTSSKQTPGQFAPLAGGGPNASSGFEGGTVLNPWDFLLCLEGTLLFAAAATKRLDSSSPGGLAFPFTVRAVGAGAGSVALGDEPHARAETWFPLWDRPASLPELLSVLAEGRVQVSGRTARDALDFARAVSALGVQRGITAFQRYGYLQRFGRNVIAVPIDRVEVRRQPLGSLIDDLDRGDWLGRLRRHARGKGSPARLQSLVRRLEDALFDLTRSHLPARVQDVLIVLGDVQAYLALSPASREAVQPVPVLREGWVRRADDAGPEYRIAAALAGLHGLSAAADGTPRWALPMAVHFAPVVEVGNHRRWAQGGEDDAVWGPGDVRDNLCALAERRLRAAARDALPDVPWHARGHSTVDDIRAWLDGELDEARIGALLKGLVLARIPGRLRRGPAGVTPLPPAYSILKPLFATREQLDRTGQVRAGDPGGERTSDPAMARDRGAVVRLLTADRPGEAVKLGIRRLRANGMRALESLADAGHPEGKRLLAALLVPISDEDLRDVILRVKIPDREREQDAETSISTKEET